MFCSCVFKGSNRGRHERCGRIYDQPKNDDDNEQQLRQGHGTADKTIDGSVQKTFCAEF